MHTNIVDDYDDCSDYDYDNLPFDECSEPFVYKDGHVYANNNEIVMYEDDVMYDSNNMIIVHNCDLVEKVWNRSCEGANLSVM